MGKDSKVAEDKARLRDLATIKYPDLVEKYTRELCMVCGRHERVKCHHGLIPVTSTGERCPYFEAPASADTSLPVPLSLRKELQ
jgi:hypothetical protein